MGVFKDEFINSLKPSKDPSKGFSIFDGLIVIGHGITQIWPISPIVLAIRKGLGASRLFTEPDASELHYLDSESTSSKELNRMIRGMLYEFPKKILNEFWDFYRSEQWLESPIHLIASLTLVPAFAIGMIALSYFFTFYLVIPFGITASVVEATLTIAKGAAQLILGTLISSTLGIAALAETIVENAIAPAIERAMNVGPKIIPTIKAGAQNLLDSTKGFLSKAGNTLSAAAKKAGSTIASGAKNLFKSKPKPEPVKEKPLENITVVPTEKTALLPPKATTLSERINQFDLDFPSPPTEPPVLPPLPAYGEDFPDASDDEADLAPAPAHKGRAAVPS